MKSPAVSDSGEETEPGSGSAKVRLTPSSCESFLVSPTTPDPFTTSQNIHYSKQIQTLKLMVKLVPQDATDPG